MRNQRDFEMIPLIGWWELDTTEVVFLGILILLIIKVYFYGRAATICGNSEIFIVPVACWYTL